MYGVHVCTGSAYASAGRQRSLLGEKEKKERPWSPGHIAKQLSRDKSGGKPEERTETNLPQERWVGTVARVPGWFGCKGQGGKGSVKRDGPAMHVQKKQDPTRKVRKRSREQRNIGSETGISKIQETKGCRFARFGLQAKLSTRGALSR